MWFVEAEEEELVRLWKLFLEGNGAWRRRLYSNGEQGGLGETGCWWISWRLVWCAVDLKVRFIFLGFLFHLDKHIKPEMCVQVSVCVLTLFS